MYRYSAYCLNFSSEVELPECEVANHPTNDFQITIQQLSPPPLETTNIHRRGILAHTAVEANGTLWLHWEGVATFRATGGTLLEVDVHTHERDVISLFTVSEAIGLILFQRGYFLLHASAVKVGDCGWVFMGNPGAGKSTTCAAFVKAGCQLLSDDLTAIGFDSVGKPFLYPAFPQLKIWEKSVEGLGFDRHTLTPVTEGINKFALAPRNDFHAEPVPLERMYFIHRNEDAPVLRSISRAEFPPETLRHFPMPNQFLTPEVLQSYFNQSLLCAKSAQAYELKRIQGFQMLEKWVAARIAESGGTSND
jgi:hypothetical protein